MFFPLSVDKKMKLKLIMPPKKFRTDSPGMIPLPPLGMAYISSYLKKLGYQVDLDDLEIKFVSNNVLYQKILNLQNNYTDEDLENFLLDRSENSYLSKLANFMLDNIEFGGYDVIGFSIVEATALDAALLMSKRLKQITDSKIVLGGLCIRKDMEQRYEFIDKSFVGNAEHMLVHFLNELQNIRNEKTILPAIIPRSEPDFSTLPIELYKYISSAHQYRNPGNILILPYIWTWGCPNKCSFCKTNLNKEELFFKPSKEIVSEIKNLTTKYDTKFLFIMNDYIHVSEKHIKDLCQELLKEKVDVFWCGSARCDINSDLIPIIARAGCRYLGFGFESGSNKILNLMNKKYSLKKFRESLIKAKSSNIWVNLFVMVCFPHETEEDYMETFNFIHKNIEYIDEISVCSFRLVDSLVFRNPEKYGITFRGKFMDDKNNYKGVFAYDEIKGMKWEEIQVAGKSRIDKLRKLLYIYKNIPSSYLRSSLYQLFYAYSTSNSKKSAYNYIEQEYKKECKKKEKIIHVSNVCNNNCTYCKKPNTVISSSGGIKNRIKELRNKNVEWITISGGEPTLNPDLIEIINIIHKEGFKIRLNTNARMLAYPHYAEELFRVGINRISVPIFSKEHKAHDKITKVKGSLDQSINGIKNWKKLGGDVEIRTIPVPENENRMVDTIDLILKLETVENY